MRGLDRVLHDATRRNLQSQRLEENRTADLQELLGQVKQIVLQRAAIAIVDPWRR
jgi:hypothetical protein